MRVSFVLLSLLFGLTATSHAVERPLPTDGKVGRLSVSEQRQFLIDGDAHQLTAGAQIRTAQNTLIQPQTLIPKLTGLKAYVLYTENNQGQVHRMWLLTPQEARRYASKMPKEVLPLSPLSPPKVAPDRTARPSVPNAPDRTATPSVPTEK
jgi:hypothetical protein